MVTEKKDPNRHGTYLRRFWSVSTEQRVLLLLCLVELHSYSRDFAQIIPKAEYDLTTKIALIEDRKLNLIDSHDGNILIEWTRWKDFERVLESIWEGNLFCDEITSAVNRYHKYIEETVPRRDGATPAIPRIYVRFEFSCYDLFMNSIHGTGNYIQSIYMMRLAVRYLTSANIKLNVTCTDAEELQKDFVLPWFTGTWYSPKYFETDAASTESIANRPGPPALFLGQPSPVLFCGPYYHTPTAMMYREMQYDVRRMAVALFGTSSVPKNHVHSRKLLEFVRDNIYQPGSLRRRYQQHQAKKKTKKDFQYMYLTPGNQQERFNTTTHLVPVISTKKPIELDDAVVHFRCGDLLLTSLNSYGFMTFDGYSRHISPEARTIGILTQPFGLETISTNPMEEALPVQHRTLDTSNLQVKQRCRTLVLAFADHLNERFPSAKVSIRNDRSETITMAYFRIVMANQTIGAMSTFSVFPMVGSFGTGYYQYPRDADPSKWLRHWEYPVSRMGPDGTGIVLFEESNLLLGSKTRDLWDAYGEDVVLEWFRTGKYSITSQIQ
jgi:hypothetical protein